MKTTVDIPDDLYGQARKLAAARGQQVAALITEGLEKLLGSQQPQPASKTRENGKSHQTALPSKAVRWLAEWRSLSRQRPSTKTASPSASETVRRMRR